MQWFYSLNGQRQGPVTQAEFDQLIANGVIMPDTLVWRQGMADWSPWSKISGGAPAAGEAGDDTAVCVVSGKRFPKREMIQYEGQWISAEHRDAYFQRLREGVAQPGRFIYGNFWPRFGAKFIDGLILGVIGILVNVALGAVMLGSANYFTGVQRVAGTSAAILFQVTTTLVGEVIGLIYLVFFIRNYSATPGKMALGLKLVRPDGSQLGVGRIIGRRYAEFLSGIILLIGYIMAASDAERRALHDRICDTRVIKSE